MNVHEKMTALADAIREKTGGSEPLGLDEMAEAVKGMSGDSYYDAFWDAYQEYGQRTNYGYGFSRQGWTDVTFKPKYDIKPTGSNACMFEYSRITSFKNCGVTIDFSKCTNLNNCFYNTAFVEIPTLDVTGCTKIVGIFGLCKSLKKIDCLKIKQDGTTNLDSCFANCESLEEITIDGVIGNDFRMPESGLLNADSVQSIIDALKDLTGSTAQTLTLHATVKANMTDNQKAQIAAKNWILA